MFDRLAGPSLVVDDYTLSAASLETSSEFTPSRFGTVRSLLETVEYCRERDVRLYGGGQFELGVGRGQIQALASLFYPEAPNDVAPGAYNATSLAGDLPTSPLEPPADPSGYRWG